MERYTIRPFGPETDAPLAVHESPDGEWVKYENAVPKFPTHITLHIDHDQHNVYHQALADYLAEQDYDDTECTPEDRAAILETGSIWELQWYPNNSVGFHKVAAATLERVLARAAD